MSIEAVKAYLAPLGVASRIRELDASSATVELAAEALGVEGARIATVALTVTLVDARDVVAVASGEGTMPAGGGDYSAAFSSAFAAAMAEALKKL